MKIGTYFKDQLKTFRYFEWVISAFCITIPLILWLTDAVHSGFRTSISDYVYMPHNYVFGMLLSIGAMLFIFNGAVYYKNADFMRISKHGAWYNIVLGISLLGVIIFPYRQYTIIHYSLAGIFFGGNAVVTGIFHKKKNRIISFILSIMTVIVFAFHLFHLVSLLGVEWLSLTVISIHFILESKGEF